MACANADAEAPLLGPLSSRLAIPMGSDTAVQVDATQLGSLKTKAGSGHRRCVSAARTAPHRGPQPRRKPENYLKNWAYAPFSACAPAANASSAAAISSAAAPPPPQLLGDWPIPSIDRPTVSTRAMSRASPRSQTGAPAGRLSAAVRGAARDAALRALRALRVAARHVQRERIVELNCADAQGGSCIEAASRGNGTIFRMSGVRRVRTPTFGRLELQGRVARRADCKAMRRDGQEVAAAVRSACGCGNGGLAARRGAEGGEGEPTKKATCSCQAVKLSNASQKLPLTRGTLQRSHRRYHQQPANS
eukprot:349615-Chlamydomonas_euryale.AAC.8